MLQLLKNNDFVFIALLTFFILINIPLPAEIIHLGENLKITFPFAADPKKRESDAPYISGNTYRSIANWCLDETNTPIDTDHVSKGDIIYVKGCLLDVFFGLVHPYIKEPYILLSCDADETNGNENQIPFINSDMLIAMGCVNCQEYRHPKIIQLPLGIPNGSAIGFPKKQDYTDIINKKIEKTIFCSSNFSVSSHRRREYAYKTIQKKNFINILPNSSSSIYSYNMAASQFCISPRGAGMDCFRTWEALILGCVPIVETSFLDPLFYRLPVLIIDDYENLAVEQINNFHQYIINNPHEFDLEKIYAKYWTDFFLKLQELARNDIELDGFIKNFKKRSFNCM
jgi:hypothetical protein